MPSCFAAMLSTLNGFLEPVEPCPSCARVFANSKGYYKVWISYAKHDLTVIYSAWRILTVIDASTAPAIPPETNDTAGDTWFFFSGIFSFGAIVMGKEFAVTD